MKKTLFISDLHLFAEQPAMAELFIQFLTNAGDEVDAIYILGDLFETWIGDDDISPFNQQIKNALSSVTQRGIPVYILHGNRDFLLGQRFLSETGCHLLPDESIVNIYDTPVLLMHGDTLCTRDITYLKSRRLMRNRLLQLFFLWLPLGWRQKLAEKFRKRSHQHIQSTPLDIMDVTHGEVKKIMQKHQVLFLVHGHTHRLGMHQFTSDHSTATRIVLGAWHHRGNVLQWDQDGGRQLIEFPFH